MTTNEKGRRKVAFVGLGNMGYPMAGHLARAGFDVAVYNRTVDKSARWQATFGGRVGSTPADAAAGAEVLCVCVGADDDVRAVVTATDGVLAGLGSGAVLVDHSTTSRGLALEIGGAAAAVGIGFVDAPVSGGQSGAENGRLSVMCGGDPHDVAKARALFETYAAQVIHLGPLGNGQLTKMVNQVLCAAAIEGAAEALNLALTVGLDPDLVMQAVTAGAANSWYLSNRGATMVRDEFDFGFAVDWMRKDLRICLDEANQRGIPLPLTTMAESDYATSQARGDGRLDATAIIRLRRDGI
jgi:3-hydroxyisobutyrate dehydrogenase